MFDYVRKHTKIMMGLMFLLIIPSFVLFGIDGYNRFREKGQVVAKVGNEEITQSEWDAEHKTESDRIRAAMPSIDAKFLDSPAARYAVLERMVHQRVLSNAAESARLTTSDARLARELQSNPTIAALRRPDGTLDVERYRMLLGSQGLTPESFEARMRADMATRQVEMAFAQSSFPANVPADLALKAFYEQREVQVARFLATDFAKQVNPTQTDIDAYYQANAALFQAPEQAKIEYIVLDMDAVRKSITVSEQDIKTYYEQNVARLSGAEERRASHILITAGKDASASDRDAAKAKAQTLLEQVRKAPDTFSEVARKNSQDPGSAAKGGDLDFFGKGAMVKPFEDAVFNMKKGDISDVVASDFGFHIIKLTDIKAPKQKTFAELRVSLEEELKAQMSRARYAEAAESFTNGVYEQSDSLKPVADKLKLDISTASDVRRQPMPGTKGVLASSKLLSAIFSPDSIEKKRNTEAVETAPSQLVAARILQYTPAQTQPLAQVQQQVRDQLVKNRSAELAAKEGAAKLADWKANPAAAALDKPALVSRDRPLNLPLSMLDAVMRADASKLPVFVGVDVAGLGYLVARVNSTVAPADTQTKKQDRAQYSQWWTMAENQAYYKLLKEKFKVQMKVDRPVEKSPMAALGAD
jgi:peptidyl-prolyl cis-trans isomerase D